MVVGVRPIILNSLRSVSFLAVSQYIGLMVITVFAICFLILILAISLFGFKAVIKQGKRPEDINKEKCSLCRKEFLKSQLVDRQVGDMRVYFFCVECIAALSREITGKN